MKIVGNAAGMTIPQKQSLSRRAKHVSGFDQMAPECRGRRFAVLMRAGTKAANQITRIFAALPKPSQRITSGIQASGGIGRIIWKIGLTIAAMRGPIPSPSRIAVPVPAATEKSLDHQLEACKDMDGKGRAAKSDCENLDQRFPDERRGWKTHRQYDSRPVRWTKPRVTINAADVRMATMPRRLGMPALPPFLSDAPLSLLSAYRKRFHTG